MEKKKIQKSLTHLKAETTGHSRSLTIILPSVSYDYLQHSIALFITCPASTWHCVLQCARISAMQQFYLPSSSASCRMKTFLLHLSKHIAAGKRSHSSCPCKQDWLICRLQPLVLNKGWFLQSRCILGLQQKSFAPNVGISRVIS